MLLKIRLVATFVVVATLCHPVVSFASQSRLHGSSAFFVATHPNRQPAIFNVVKKTKLDFSSPNSKDVVRPDPSILLSSRSDLQQQLGVAIIGASLLVGAFTVSNFWTFLEDLTGGFLPTSLITLPLGLIYILLGATHFFYKDEYVAIVPPTGTWGGLWNVPAPGAQELGLSEAEFHVVWSGVAEIGGGMLLILGGFGTLPIQIPGTLMFLLTLAVSPANIYMFTHDVPLAMAPPLEYPRDHIVRAILQIVLLSIFFNMATHA